MAKTAQTTMTTAELIDECGYALAWLDQATARWERLVEINAIKPVMRNEVEVWAKQIKVIDDALATKRITMTDDGKALYDKIKAKFATLPPPSYYA